MVYDLCHLRLLCPLDWLPHLGQLHNSAIYDFDSFGPVCQCHSFGRFVILSFCHLRFRPVGAVVDKFNTTSWI